MEQVQRMSISDFKLKEMDNQNEIENLLGGVASGCHITTTELFNGSGVHFVGTDSDDCFPLQPKELSSFRIRNRVNFCSLFVFSYVNFIQAKKNGDWNFPLYEIDGRHNIGVCFAPIDCSWAGS